MESRTVQQVAPEYADWLVEAATNDNFREPKDTTAVKSLPYAEAAAGRAKTLGPVTHQPAGALTGKTVFAMAGHGWTYDPDEMYYYTQRGLSNGMVEDIGNADQMHIFAHMAFNAGATVIPLRPVDHQPEERILDNTMPQVELYGDWKKGASDKFFGPLFTDIPYVAAAANLQETAVARFRPYLPKAGYYPVYVWARDGADRSNQQYRIAYAGGVAECRVNWRRFGKSWVWLGTYYFEAGTAGYVETTNQVIDPYEAYNGHVVVADAVRFGNGLGDVPRPAGVSGFSREDEGDSYWIERALGNNVDRRVYDSGRDGNSTVSAPPKAAAYINRETEASFLDRILISFHSNASTGKARGAIALYNAKAEQRPTYQEGLAELLGEELNKQMKQETPPTGVEWPERERNTYSGINFGELRRDYLQNEMCATIVETAFHDNAADAAFMLNPLSRMHMAQATFRGILRWYSEIVNPNSAYTLPPSRPAALVARRSKEGRIDLKWTPGSTGEFDGGTPINLRVYRSDNGFGFDGGIAFPAASETIAVDPLTTNGTTFIRVTASNSAGESFPSQTVAVGMAESSTSKAPTALLISLNTVLDATSNVPYELDKQPGGPYKDGAVTHRVRPIYTMMEPAGHGEAEALGALNIAFEGTDSAAIDNGLVDLSTYKRVFICGENQNPESSLFSEKLIAQLRALLNKNGKVFIGGSGLAANLASKGNRQKALLQDVLGITGSDTVIPEPTIQSADERFLPTTGTITLNATSRFWTDQQSQSPTAFTFRKGRSLALLTFNGNPGSAAAVLTRPFYSEGEVVTFGFPLSLIALKEHRTGLMQAILKQM